MATLVLNVTPVLIREGTTVLVACLPYESREQLRALRQQHGKDVLFARSRDSIDAVHFVRDVRPFDGELHEKPLNNEPRIAARLIERAIVSKLVGLGRTILDVDPIHFLSEKDSDDVVKATGAPLP